LFWQKNIQRGGTEITEKKGLRANAHEKVSPCSPRPRGETTLWFLRSPFPLNSARAQWMAGSEAGHGESL
jgi:hypothetical protein